MSQSATKKPFKWSAIQQARKKGVAGLLDAPAFKDVFNDKFVDGLERRRDTLQARILKVHLFQLIALLILAMAVLSFHLAISLFGVSANDARNVRELLLVISSTAQLFNAVNIMQSAQISEFIDGYAWKLAKGNAMALNAIRLRYGLANNDVVPNIEGARTRKWYHLFIAREVIIGLITWVLAALMFTAFIQIAAMVDIIRDPTISFKVSILVIIYVLLSDFAAGGVQIVTGTFWTGYKER